MEGSPIRYLPPPHTVFPNQMSRHFSSGQLSKHMLAPLSVRINRPRFCVKVPLVLPIPILSNRVLDGIPLLASKWVHTPSFAWCLPPLHFHFFFLSPFSFEKWIRPQPTGGPFFGRPRKLTWGTRPLHSVPKIPWYSPHSLPSLPPV
jgi:hypothetical protein